MQAGGAAGDIIGLGKNIEMKPGAFGRVFLCGIACGGGILPEESALAERGRKGSVHGLPHAQSAFAGAGRARKSAIAP